jgi:hypothetical protein
MRKSFTPLSIIVALALGSGAPTAIAAETCPNEQLRAENSSTALPDCRAYELVSPDLNHATLGFVPNGRAASDGNTMVYTALDAPEDASSSQALFDYVRATRDAISGWRGASMSPPTPTTVGVYGVTRSFDYSADLSSTAVQTDQPLSDGSVPAGQNLFVGHLDGVFHLMTTVGSPFNSEFKIYPPGEFVWGNADFSHVYFRPAVAQLESDPTSALNAYAWSEDRGLRLIGILPDGKPAPNGASFGAASQDGKYVAFTAEGKLYLRIDDSNTVQLGVSQRAVEDPNPLSTPTLVSVADDGSKVLFTSSSELTDDANTGESGGVATDAGRDLYSYDTTTKQLTDLTVDTNPADVATGVDVQSVLAKTQDGSHVYFKASGDLAAGAAPGHTSVYVWHEGQIDFVADAGGLGGIYTTPNGRHVALLSTASLTGYDNADPVSGQPHNEVFEATVGGGIECASCRVDGTRPTGDASIGSVSEDGTRVFFASKDAVLSHASSGASAVFEYAGGSVATISRVGGPSAVFLAASASGDDVFFDTYDTLVPNPNSGDEAAYDARVGGGFAVHSRRECAGETCHGLPGSAPVLGASASSSLSSVGNSAFATSTTPVKAKTKAQIRARKLAKALKECRSKHNKKRRTTCEKKAHRSYGRGK